MTLSVMSEVSVSGRAAQLPACRAAPGGLRLPQRGGRATRSPSRIPQSGPPQARRGAERAHPGPVETFRPVQVAAYAAGEARVRAPADVPPLPRAGTEAGMLAG